MLTRHCIPSNAKYHKKFFYAHAYRIETAWCIKKYYMLGTDVETWFGIIREASVLAAT